MQVSLSKAIELVKPLDAIGGGAGAGAGGGEFQAVLGGVLNNIKTTANESSQQVSAWMNGEQTDIHQVAMSIQKAGLTFEVAMEVRNKMMLAYQEVMRMQI